MYPSGLTMNPDPAPSSRNVVKNPRMNRSVVTETTQGSISSTTSASDGSAPVIVFFATSAAACEVVSEPGGMMGVGGTGVYVGSGVGLGSGGGPSPHATAASRERVASIERAAPVRVLARIDVDDPESDA